MIDLLVKELGVRRVVLFGSLRHQGFDEWSDLDLAVEGLDSADYFEAMRRIEEIVEVATVDLVRMEEARERLRHRIEDEGEVLYDARRGDGGGKGIEAGEAVR